jgi:hypothetical protein
MSKQVMSSLPLGQGCNDWSRRRFLKSATVGAGILFAPRVRDAAGNQLVVGELWTAPEHIDAVGAEAPYIDQDGRPCVQVTYGWPVWTLVGNDRITREAIEIGKVAQDFAATPLAGPVAVLTATADELARPRRTPYLRGTFSFAISSTRDAVTIPWRIAFLNDKGGEVYSWTLPDPYGYVPAVRRTTSKPFNATGELDSRIVLKTMKTARIQMDPGRWDPRIV